MKNVKKLIAAAGALMLATMLVVSCQKEQTVADEVPAGMKKLHVFLTDDPSLIFDSIFIDIRILEVKVETANGTELWDTLPIRAGVYNILKFRNGVDTLLTAAYIPNGEVKKIRLTLGTQNSVMKNGNRFPLALHNNNRQVIIDIPDVDHIDPNTFAIWIDFDGHGSIIRLHDNVFELNPRIHTFSNSNGARIEGEIKPRAALPAIVKVISGTDTLLTVTDDDDGEFKIRGIRSNTVKLMVIPSNGYRDSVRNNIQLSPGSETKLGDIVLHQ